MTARPPWPLLILAGLLVIPTGPVIGGCLACSVLVYLMKAVGR